MVLTLTPAAIECIPTVLFYAINAVLLACIAYKIFINHYECKCYIICFPVFSDHHNWIREPSSSNKIYALLSVLSIMFYYISAIPYNFTLIWQFNIDYSTMMLTYPIPSTFSTLGRIFYFLYFASTLEYQMNLEPIIKKMISKKLIIFMKLLQVIYLLVAIIDTIIWLLSNTAMNGTGGFYHGIPYELISGFMVLGIRIFSEIILSWLYYRGLNNLCHWWWYTKEIKRNERYVETQRIHQILNIITRATIIVSISFMITIIAIAYNVIGVYVVGVYGSVYQYYTYTIFSQLLHCVDDITYGLSIYFIYEFGHEDYEKCCNKCHICTYNYFINKHKNKVERGRFKDDKYVPNHQNSKVSSCCSSCKKKEVVEQEYVLLVEKENVLLNKEEDL